MTHPGMDFVSKVLKEVSLGEADVLPAFRVHRAVRLASLSSRHYAALSHATWNAIINPEHGWDSLRELEEETNPGLIPIVEEAREVIGTALAKRKGIILMASPITAVTMLQAGYRIRLLSSRMDGTNLPRCSASVGYLNEQPASRKDVATGWRPWKAVLDTVGGVSLRVDDLPRFLRCRSCLIVCDRIECPFEVIGKVLLVALALMHGSDLTAAVGHSAYHLLNIPH